MQIDVDARLAAAAGGAARYFADSAGLDQQGVSDLQSAVIGVCEEAFHELGSDQASVDVTLTRLVDRIEVQVSHKAGATAKLDAQHVPSAAAGESLEGVDDVQHEIHDGLVITRLTKFIKQGAASR